MSRTQLLARWNGNSSVANGDSKYVAGLFHLVGTRPASGIAQYFRSYVYQRECLKSHLSKVEKEHDEQMDLANNNGMHSQSCLVASGNFVDFQTQVVRLCLPNHFSNPVVSTDAASDQIVL